MGCFTTAKSLSGCHSLPQHDNQSSSGPKDWRWRSWYISSTEVSDARILLCKGPPFLGLYVGLPPRPQLQSSHKLPLFFPNSDTSENQTNLPRSFAWFLLLFR